MRTRPWGRRDWRSGAGKCPALTGPLGNPPPAATYDEPAIVAAPVPLSGPPGPPPSQGQTAMAFGPSSELPWSWHLMPTGLMYRSYLAGIKEPRIGSAWLTDSQLGPRDDTRLDTDAPGKVWDATLGGRVGILRYGTPNAYRPEGFQVDLLGSAQPRLNPYGFSSPVLSIDYTVGIPVTFALGKWQYKTGYNHLSSHFGDEFLINNPSYLSSASTDVRDSIILGVGYFVTDALRVFGEFDYAMGAEDGAKPVEFQFGADFSPAHPGGCPSSPSMPICGKRSPTAASSSCRPAGNGAEG